MTGVLVKPDGQGPFPAVVLLHSCGGLRGYISSDWPKFLSRNGYVALAVDSFGSRNLGPCPNSLSPPAPGAKVFASGVMISDAHGALDWLARQSFAEKDRVAVMGFSLGGMAIHFSLLRSYNRAIRPQGFKVAISMYGPCAVRGGSVTIPVLKRSPMPLLEIIGDRDESLLRECRNLLPGGPNTALHILRDAYHNFDNSRLSAVRYSARGSPMLYSPRATRIARDLVRAFLHKHLDRSLN